jgi:WD domain, G-beta repeat
MVRWYCNPSARPGQANLSAPGPYVRHLAFTPDGQTLACAGEFEVRLDDVTTGGRLHHRPGHGAQVLSVAISPDGAVVASAAWDERDKPHGRVCHPDGRGPSLRIEPRGELRVGRFGAEHLHGPPALRRWAHFFGARTTNMSGRDGCDTSVLGFCAARASLL